LTATGFLFALFYIYGTLHFYKDPGSMFYDRDRATKREYTAIRQEEAIAFTNQVEEHLKDPINSSEISWKVGQRPSICVVFVTVARPSLTGHHPLQACALF
jgi:nickel-dependent lactate racemase